MNYGNTDIRLVERAVKLGAHIGENYYVVVVEQPGILQLDIHLQGDWQNFYNWRLFLRCLRVLWSTFKFRGFFA